MFNRILQTLLFCLFTILLTTGVALSSPSANGILIANHSPEHNAVPIETPKQDSQAGSASQPANSFQVEEPNSAQAGLRRDRSPEVIDSQPTQANPSVPYDPYDYDIMREMNREIYGEAKGKQG